MNIVKKFDYQKLKRNDGGVNGRTYVDPTGANLASVTTILDKTKSEETKNALDGWRKSIGLKKAQEITEEAAFRGTLMHDYLERHLKGENPISGTNFYHKQSFKMSTVVLETYLKPFLDEIWGLETTLYYPEIYAGTTDLVGVYQGIPSVLDYKQSNRLKTDDRVVDYKLQLSAYILAHNKVYGTDIQQGVILMCTKDLEPQRWVLRGEELEDCKAAWWQRVSQFYQI